MSRFALLLCLTPSLTLMEIYHLVRVCWKSTREVSLVKLWLSNSERVDGAFDELPYTRPL